MMLRMINLDPPIYLNMNRTAHLQLPTELEVGDKNRLKKNLENETQMLSLHNRQSPATHSTFLDGLVKLL
jgi:hypothetical protein